MEKVKEIKKKLHNQYLEDIDIISVSDSIQMAYMPLL